jgi:hypothetical protein
MEGNRRQKRQRSKFMGRNPVKENNLINKNIEKKGRTKTEKNKNI